VTLPAEQLGARLSDRRAVIIAWIAWAVLLAVVCGVILAGSKRTVTPYYTEAALSWTEGSDIYRGSGTGFLYCPQAAIAFVPFAWLPTTPREIAWRVLTIGVFAAGVWRLSRLAGRRGGPVLTPFPIVTLLSVPVAWDAARNGQSTLPMAGLMMLAAGDIADRRWWRATVMLSLALVLKPLALVMILLAAAVYAPLRWRLPIGFVAVALLPFLTQHPSYVIEQYGDFFREMRAASRHTDRQIYADLFGMFEAWGADVIDTVRLATRLVVALLTLGMTVLVVRRFSPSRAATLLYAFSACYLMLMNPRAELNTYAMLAPVMGVVAAHALLIGRSVWTAVLIGAGAIGLTLSYEIAQPFPWDDSVWVAPLIGSVFTAGVVVATLRRPPDRHAEQAPAADQPTER